MNKSTSSQFIVFITVVLFWPPQANACNSAQSGSWSDSQTWTSCPTNVPDLSSMVTLSNGHNVILDIDTTINGLYMQPGSELTIGSDGHAITGTDGFPANLNFNEGIITLEGDLSFGNNVLANITLGQINGSHTLNVGEAAQVVFSGQVGSSTPLSNINFAIPTVSPGNIVFDTSSITLLSQINLNTNNLLVLQNIVLNTGQFNSSGSIINQNNDLMINNSLDSVVSAIISGTGNLFKSGAGTLDIQSVSTYTGTTTVQAGRLLLSNTNSNNPLPTSTEIQVDSGAELDFGNGDFTFELSNGQTLSGSGTVLDAVNFPAGTEASPGSSPGILTTGSVTFNPGARLTLELNGPTAGVDYDQLHVNGVVDFSDSTGSTNDINIILNYNPLSGTEFVLINNDGIDPIIGEFAGLAEGSGFASPTPGFNFTVTYQGGDGNDFALVQGRNTCSTQTNGSWHDAATWTDCEGQVPQPVDRAIVGHAVSIDTDVQIETLFGINGGELLIGTGDITVDVPNTWVTSVTPVVLSGNLTINSDGKIELGEVNGAHSMSVNTADETDFRGSIGQTNPLNTLITDGAGSTHIRADLSSALMFINEPVILTNSVTLQASFLNLASGLDNGGFDLITDVSGNDSGNNFGSGISGNGGLIKQGEGLMFFNANNSFTGDTLIQAGTLAMRLSGSGNFISNSPNIIISEGAELQASIITGGEFIMAAGQNLRGEGRVTGTLSTSNGAVIAPGNSPGQLTTNDLNLISDSTMNIELNGTSPGTGYDQIQLNGAVNLNSDNGLGAKLNHTFGYEPQAGDTWVIIDNDGTDSVTGQFSNWPNGENITIDAFNYSMDYFGGDGNDVVLHALGPVHLFVDFNTPADEGSCDFGTCWDNAITDLNSALELAGVNTQVWVATGVYKPVNTVPEPRGGDPLEASFVLPSGVQLYGGFAGTESSLKERSPDTNPTILSGDIDNNDDNTDGNFIAESHLQINGFNAYHVITASQLSHPTVIDGFTITAGSALGLDSPDQEWGGGMLCDNGGPDIIDVRFIGNEAFAQGGATHNCYNLIQNSQFINNHSIGDGGAISISPSIIPKRIGVTTSGLIQGSDFRGNTAQSNGGAIDADDATMLIELSAFAGNSAGNAGAIKTNRALDLINVLLQNNVATDDVGGAIVFNSNEDMLLSNVTMIGNRSIDGGSLLADSSGAITIDNSLIWNNQDESGTGAAINIGSSTVLISQYSFLQGSGGSSNWNPDFGIDGGNNQDTDPLFNAVSNPSTAPEVSGNPRLQLISPAINAGNNGLVLLAEDLDGNARIQDTTVDVGAYEGFDDVIFINGFDLD